MSFPKKIITVFLTFAISISLLAIPSSAATYTNTGTFWNWAYDHSHSWERQLIGLACNSVCPVTDDGYHYATEYVFEHDSNSFVCKCIYCGVFFDAYDSDFAAMYDTYVTDIESEYGTTSFVSSNRVYPHRYEWTPSTGSILEQSDSHVQLNMTSTSGYLYYHAYFTVSKAGNYTFNLPSITYSCDQDHLNSYSTRVSILQWEPGASNATSVYTSDGVSYKEATGKTATFGCIPGVEYEVRFYFTNFNQLIHELEFSSAPYYSGSAIEIPFDVSTRPLTVSGNFGIISDNGTVVNVYNTAPFDEETLIFTEPQTGTQYQTTGWTYDYNDRYYELTLESGTMTVNDTDVATVGILYGDEEMAIGYLDASGNLITADTYAYLVETTSEEPGTGDTAPEDGHKHSYTSEVTREATCTTAGKETYTCSCGDSYTEKIPATGHTWQIAQQVNNSYDETGALITEGYTIYECSDCGEQYKSTDGKPPAGSSGGTIWEKLGNLFGTIADGAISMIETAVGKLLDALISLVEMLNEKLNAVLDTVLSLFDRVPDLFGGFTGLLSAVFPFLPAEFMDVLLLGLIALVFAALLRYFIKRG